MASNSDNNSDDSLMKRRLKATSILKEALVAFYQIIDPSRLPKLDALLQKYWMNEKVYVARIVKKYGTDSRVQSQLAALQQALSLFLAESQRLSSGSSSGLTTTTNSPFAQSHSSFPSGGTSQQQSPFETPQSSFTSSSNLSTSAAKDPNVLKNALVALYQVVDPSKIPKLDGILQKYRTNEKVYVERICKKYGADVRVRSLFNCV